MDGGNDNIQKLTEKYQDLGYAFLNAYLERTGDYAGVQHLAFYSVYRALVRAMVDCLGAENDVAHRQDFQKRLQLRIKTAAALVMPMLFVAATR